MNFKLFRKYNPEGYRGMITPPVTKMTNELSEQLRLKKMKMILDANVNGLTVDPTFRPKSPALNIMVKTTHACNLDCPYCYDTLKQDKTVMSLKTVEKIAEVFCTAPAIKIVWHGGEPMIAGKEWFKEANKTIRKYMPDANIGMQTNGSLIDEEWMDIFDEFNIHIGMSYDGLSNDTTRGTTDQILKNLELFKKRKRLPPGLALVITKQNVNNLIEEHEYRKTLEGTFSRFSLMNYTGTPGDKDLLDESDLPALIKYLHYWARDKKGGTIAFADNLLQMVIGNNSSCTRGINCQTKYYGIEPNGNISPCGRNWTTWGNFGNIQDYFEYTEIKSHCNSKAFKELAQQAYNAPECEECKWKIPCAGDCFNNRHIYGDILHPVPMQCTIMKALFEEIYKILQEIDVYSDWKWNPIILQYLAFSDYLSPHMIERTCMTYGLKV